MHIELNSNFQYVETILFNIAGCIDFCANSLLIYLILFKSATMHNFRFYMLYFQASTFLVDIYLTLLMKPIPIFPVIGGYTIGLLSTVFHVSSHIQMTVILVLMSVQVVAIWCSFLRKHQTIVSIDGRKVLGTKTYWSLIVLPHFGVITGSLMFYFSNISKEEQIQFIRNNIPQLGSQLAQLPCLQIYDRVGKPIVIYSLLVLLFQETFFFTCVFVLAIDIFTTLRNNHVTVSSGNMGKHRAMFRSLFAQFIVLLFCFLPSCVGIIILIFDIPYIQEVSGALLCIYSIHSFLGCIVMIFTYQPYWNTILLWLGLSKNGLDGSPSIFVMKGKQSRLSIRKIRSWFNECKVVF
uniref:Uncharacterized protein n=2 Tax=Caenorhabditis japonica TaxID=281687 RepID=A0A8R1HZQ4_CAEJA